MPEFYMVTGTPRSGTSLVAAACESMGIDMGSEFMPADAFNPTGYWEDLRFVGWILTVARPDRFEPRVLRDGDLQDEFRESLRGLFGERRMKSGGPYGVKNNFLGCVTESFIREAGMPVHLVRVGRDTKASVDSYLAMILGRGQLRVPPREEIEASIEAFVAIGDAAEEAVRQAGGRVLSLDLSNFAEDANAVVGQLADFIGRQPTQKTYELYNPEFVHF